MRARRTVSPWRRPIQYRSRPSICKRRDRERCYEIIDRDMYKAEIIESLPSKIKDRGNFCLISSNLMDIRPPFFSRSGSYSCSTIAVFPVPDCCCGEKGVHVEEVSFGHVRSKQKKQKYHIYNMEHSSLPQK